MKASRRIGIRAAVWGLALVLLVCAVVFFSLAGYLYLAQVMQPYLAALATGSGLLVLVGIALSVPYWRTARRKVQHRRQHRSETIDLLEEILQSRIDPLLRGWILRHSEGAAASTFVLGILAGYSRTVRRLLQEFYDGYAEAERQRRTSRGD